MPTKKDEKQPEDEFEVRFVKTDSLGKATGSVFHWTECGMIKNAKPEQRAVVEDAEIKLLGLQPCTRCWRITHKPDVEEGLGLLKSAVRLAIEEIHRGRNERAEEHLASMLAFVEGNAERPSLDIEEDDEAE